MRLLLVIHWLSRQVVLQKKKTTCRVAEEVLISMSYVLRTYDVPVGRLSVSRDSGHNAKRPTREFCLAAYMIIKNCINMHNLTTEGFMIVCNVFESPVIV